MSRHISWCLPGLILQGACLPIFYFSPLPFHIQHGSHRVQKVSKLIGILICRFADWKLLKKNGACAFSLHSVHALLCGLFRVTFLSYFLFFCFVHVRLLSK